MSIVAPTSPKIPILDDVYEHYKTDVASYKTAAEDTSPTDLQRAKYFRNKIAYNFMGEIDYVYGRYAGGLFSVKATASLLADFESLGLTAASAISLAARTKTILASLATGVAGVNLSADKNFFGQQAFQALAIAMQARRDQARASIIKNLQADVTEYPLAAVRRDLVSYFYAGTLPGALQEIQEEAAKTSHDALTPGATTARLAFSTQILNGTVDKPLGAVAVQVQDANGKVVAGATDPVTITSTTGNLKDTSTTTANAVAGVATFNNLIFSKDGTYTLTATAPGLTSATSNSFKIGAAGSTPALTPAVAVPSTATPPNKPSMEHLH